MKVSNETKVGILTITALTLLILGFNFLKGKDIFTKREKIYAIFSDLGTLSVSNEVKINGWVIGKVYALDARDKNVNGIIATINLTEDVNIPNNSMAYISEPLIGASYIIIAKGNATNYLKPGDTLLTRLDSGILDDVKAQLTPVLSKVRVTLDSLNMVFRSVNNILNSDARGNLQQTLANLNQASSSLNGLLNTQTGALARTLDNASLFTANLKNNNDSITAMISNTKQFTEKLSRLDLQKTIDTLESMVSELKRTVTKLSSKDGTLGALIHDKQLYNKLYDAILSAEILIDDLRLHPKRYVNFSLIGGKDKSTPLTSPVKKDTIPDGNK